MSDAALESAFGKAPSLSGERRLVDVLDRLLDRGVVIHGELWLTVADVDLVFVGAHLTLANPDTIRNAGGSDNETDRRDRADTGAADGAHDV